MKTSFLVSAACVCCSGLAASAAPPEDRGPVRIASLIRTLGSDSFHDRDRALDELALMGSATREHLEKAALGPDPEVRLRAKELLRRLKVQQLWQASPIELPSGPKRAGPLASLLASQAGNRVLLGEPYGPFEDAEVALGPQGEFWPLLDEICRQSGNRLKLHYDTRSPGLILVAGAPGKNPVAYAGPVRAQIIGARRAFTEELRYDDLDIEQTHTFQLDLQMLWEDRFRLVAYRSQPELVQAITDGGAELAPSQPASSGWNVAGGGARQVCMNLRLHPPSVEARELAELRLKWGLIAVGDMATLTVDDLGSRQPHYQDDLELVIDDLHSGPGPRCELTVVITRDLVTPEPQDVMFQENELELFDAEGRAFRRQGQTNTLSERGAQMKLSFVGENTMSAPAVLRLTYPRIRAEHDLEIVFRNVPLPVGRPQ